MQELLLKINLKKVINRAGDSKIDMRILKHLDPEFKKLKSRIYS